MSAERFEREILQYYQRLGLFDVFVAEEELTVEVAEIDSVQIHDMNLSKACQDEVLQKLASNPASADHQNA